MLITIILLGWWLCGVVGVTWLARDDSPMTWGQLLRNALLGIVGPLLPLIILLVVLAQADFWDKPIFPRAKRR